MIMAGKSYKEQREAILLRHPYIVETKWEMRGREADWKRTLVVMTSLTLDPQSDDYDGQYEADLLEAVTDYWKQNPSVIDAVNIRSTCSG